MKSIEELTTCLKIHAKAFKKYDHRLALSDMADVLEKAWQVMITDGGKCELEELRESFGKVINDDKQCADGEDCPLCGKWIYGDDRCGCEATK